MNKPLAVVLLASSTVFLSGFANAAGTVLSDNEEATVCIQVQSENGLLKIADNAPEESGVMGTAGALGDHGASGVPGAETSTVDYISTFTNYPTARYPTPLVLAH